MNFSNLLVLAPSIAAHSARNIGADPWIQSAAPNHSAKPGTITFYESATFKNLLTQSQPSALILPACKELQEQANSAGIAWVETDNPKLSFAEILEILHPEQENAPGIDSSAQIHPSANIGKHVFIGPLAIVGAHCTVNDGCIVHASTILNNGVELGRNCIIHSGAVLNRRSRLGDNCIVHSNAVIGSEGFGFVRSEKGLKRIPQTGIVILEDGVEIGCNTCVDRPAMGETRIGKGTKIDNLVQIGHGVEIGTDCAIASQVGIAGAAKLGNCVVLGGQVGIADKTQLGDNVIAYARSGITGNLEAGEIVSGFPAIPAKMFARSAAAFKVLPQMLRSLRKLQKLLLTQS